MTFERRRLAADAMPYHRHRRLVCNRRFERPGAFGQARCKVACSAGVARSGGTGSTGLLRRLDEGPLATVELQVREARLTDIDRVIGLIERADSSWTLDRLSDAADVLRRLLYLPNGSLLVALDGRMIVGAAVLALRPSVSAGVMLGVIDLLAVEPGHELDGVTEALLRELIRIARNKGCLYLESEPPQDGTAVARWEQAGFTESGPRLRCPLTRAAAALTW